VKLPDWNCALVIYVPLLNEGTDCWRPVEAEQVRGDTYRIVGPKPEDETWPVAAGDVVRCERRRFADGFGGLVVVISESDLPSPVS
jgi:hypothetical protein